ncbi:phenol hydroxylase subunit [Massilia sp. LXY-6]|uniref:phenol hydroxylase subunit n=1 Tax=Massilia sp. LXY-6 TaxID=3379823 RepID=UPI003EDF7D3B
MQADTPSGAVMDVGKRYVRITGSHQGFVEFDFAIGDPDITVELILPKSAFDEFCLKNKVVRLESTGQA